MVVKWMAKSIGVVVWTASLLLVVGLLVLQPLPWTASVARYFTHSNQSAELVVPSPSLRPRTPIFLKLEDNQWQLVGHVTELPPPTKTSTTTVQAAWYGPQPIENYALTYYQSSHSLANVVSTLLPAEKQKLVRERLTTLYSEHSDEMIGALKPIFDKSIRESLPVIESGFRRSVETHREEIDRITERYKEDIVRQKLVPLVREEVFPVVREYAEPVAREIGREMWNRASVWRFGWRLLYDKSPLPERDLVKEEWERFVEREAIPILESHADELVEVQQKIFADIAANPRIRDQLRDIGDAVLHDKELQHLVSSIFRETLVENQQLLDVWVTNWKSEEAKGALRLVGDRIEPVVREIGDLVFGTRETGITPEFARVLRVQILGKDKRWLIASPLPANTSATAQPIVVARGDDDRAEAPLLVTNPQTLAF
jgi:hypothetical protein